MKRSISLIVLATLVSAASCYHILCVFPVPSRSHNQLGWGVVRSLLEAGHQVTWATPYPKLVKNPPNSLKIIYINSTLDSVTTVDMTKAMQSPVAGLAFVKQFANNVTRSALSTPLLRDAIANAQYNAVFTESFFNVVMAGIAAVQQVPWFVLSAVQMNPTLEAQVDEVRSIATVPLMFNECAPPMPFTARLYNTLLYCAMCVGKWREASRNVSILFVNAHEALTPAFSTPPNVVHIAGYHIDEDVPALPMDLQDLLDGSPQGVVYFSMGSVLSSSALAPIIRNELVRHFGALKQTVLWKFEEELDGLPANVHVRPWMPQTSVLAHPNVHLFITHGGMLSTLEAVNFGVPLLAMPVFGDQPLNAERAVKAGYAMKVDFFSKNMPDELAGNLKEMLANDTYHKRVKELSKVFRTRIVSPAKLIPHYVELAIETKGAYHLRSLSTMYTWYERWMLDQLAVVLIIMAVLVKLVKITVRICTRSSSKQKIVGDKKKRK